MDLPSLISVGCIFYSEKEKSVSVVFPGGTRLTNPSLPAPRCARQNTQHQGEQFSSVWGQGRFGLGIREDFLPERGVRLWKRLPRASSHPWGCTRTAGGGTRCSGWTRWGVLTAWTLILESWKLPVSKVLWFCGRPWGEKEFNWFLCFPTQTVSLGLDYVLTCQVGFIQVYTSIWNRLKFKLGLSAVYSHWDMVIILVPTDRGQIWARTTANVSFCMACVPTASLEPSPQQSLLSLVFDSYFHSACGLGLQTIPHVMLKSCQCFDGKYLWELKSDRI